jgi:hypothetical protein
MNIRSIRPLAARSLFLGAVAMLFAAGCNKKADNTSNYKSAINSYWSAHPACLWDSPKKFPVQAGTGDTGKTSDYAALVDQGLLTRTTAEKKVLIIASKQVNNYDISDKGRSAWTADPQQPGFGNFCYGHRSVSSIDSATPTTSDPGATTQVAYHYTLSDAAGWASAAETQNAYPQIHADLAGPQAAEATLTNTSNGWQVSSVPGSTHSAPATAADGQIVK